MLAINKTTIFWLIFSLAQFQLSRVESTSVTHFPTSAPYSLRPTWRRQIPTLWKSKNNTRTTKSFRPSQNHETSQSTFPTYTPLEVSPESSDVPTGLFVPINNPTLVTVSQEKGKVTSPSARKQSPSKTIAPSDQSSSVYTSNSRSISQESSDNPSEIHSNQPSWTPTYSISPTVQASQAPSDFPSLQPSLIPSASPSDLPTQIPSHVPSHTPSATPSLVCHDQAEYRSPLNNFTCQDHAQTDCTQWKFLGLHPEEVEDLIISCPESCMIDCGSLTRFNTNETYTIANVDNFLAPESVKVLESTTIDYFTAFIGYRVNKGEFSLYQVQLLSQTILIDIPENRKRRRRHLQTNSNKLAVSVLFRGFVIHLDPIIIEQYITEAIRSPGYINALQASGDTTYSSVDIQSSVSEISDNTVTVAEKSRDLAPGIISFVVIGALLIMSFAIALLLINRPKEFGKYQEKSEDSEENSIRESVRSPLIGVSFESFMRILSSRSNSTEKEGSSGTESKEMVPVQETPEVEQVPCDVETSRSDVAQHPLAGCIPPMLVFDLEEVEKQNNTKDEQQQPGDNLNTESQNLFPSRQMTATTSFRQAVLVGTNKPPIDESMYEGVILEARSAEPYMCSTSADSDDEVFADIEKEPSELKKSASEGALDSASSTNNNNTTTKIQQRSLRSFKVKRKRSWTSDRTSSPDSRTSSQGRSMETTTEQEVERNTRPKKKSDNGSPIQIKNNKPVANSRFIQTIMSFTPRNFQRLSSDPETESLDENSVEPNNKNTTTVTEPLDITATPKSIPKAGGTIHIFWAPLKGKLGLLIRCREHIGPIVTEVKDYSPLLGHVQVSDRIIEIDGTSTVAMSITEVLALLSTKQSSTTKHSTLLRLVVWRSSSSSSTPTLSTTSTMSQGRKDVPSSLLDTSGFISNDSDEEEEEEKLHGGLHALNFL